MQNLTLTLFTVFYVLIITNCDLTAFSKWDCKLLNLRFLITGGSVVICTQHVGLLKAYYWYESPSSQRGAQNPDLRVRFFFRRAQQTMNKLSAKISPSSGPLPITLHLPTSGNVFFSCAYTGVLILFSYWDNLKHKGP